MFSVRLPRGAALLVAFLLALSPVGDAARAQSPADRLNARSVFQRDSTGAMLAAPPAAPVAAPGAPAGVLGRYRAAHEQRVLDRLVGPSGGVLRPVAVPPLPLVSAEAQAWDAFISYQDLPVTVDSLPPIFTVDRVAFVPPQERLAFRNRFRHTRWAYAGTSYRTALDTSQTWRLRAALEGRYGPPTQTLSDLGADVRLGPGTAFMFEYWFVVNDSLPLVVTDAGSPTDRGLVVGTDGEQRVSGALVRDLLFGTLPTDALRPYADYRFDAEASTWEVVGFDGVRLVRRTIPRPDFRLAGRPALGLLAAPPPRGR